MSVKHVGQACRSSMSVKHVGQACQSSVTTVKHIRQAYQSSMESVKCVDKAYSSSIFIEHIRQAYSSSIFVTHIRQAYIRQECIIQAWSRSSVKSVQHGVGQACSQSSASTKHAVQARRPNTSAKFIRQPSMSVKSIGQAFSSNPSSIARSMLSIHPSVQHVP
jgi:hypothetical protein